jgi:hypothetical protein
MTLRKVRLEWLFYFVALATLLEQGASVIHLVRSYSWTNADAVAPVMAIITVLSSAVLTLLLIVTKSGVSRFYLLTALFIVALAEWSSNFWIAMLIAQHNMTASDATAIFGWSALTGRAVAAFLYGGIIPMTVFLQVLAITKWAETLMEQPPVNEFAERIRRQNAG